MLNTGQRINFDGELLPSVPWFALLLLSVLCVLVGCTDDPSASATVPAATGAIHKTHIRAPGQTPVVTTSQGDANCMSCHATRPPDRDNTAAKLDEFHQGLHVAHGTISCLSCHNDNDYRTLRLADGRAIPFSRTMELCAQCHGPQARDYANGSHGGMTGHWDLRTGPRQRNSCQSCHDPHAPAYPQVTPLPPPLDALPVEDHHHD